MAYIFWLTALASKQPTSADKYDLYKVFYRRKNWRV